MRPSSCPSQAVLLRDRGDLCGKRASFKVELNEPTPLALQMDNPLSRIGLDLRHAPAAQRLVVAEVDKNPRRKTPVGRYNLAEERRSNRDKDEKHANFALLPGDRLRSVNDVGGGTAMLAELEGAVSVTTPKKVNLAISRNLTDVLILAPSPIPGGEPQFRELPNMSPEKPSTAPPAQRGSSSMTPFTKKRGLPSRNSTSSSCPVIREAPTLRVGTAPVRGRAQLSQAGRVALAF